MNLNQNGQIAQQCWDEIPNHFPHTQLGGFVVMPNHIHGVIHIRHHQTNQRNTKYPWYQNLATQLLGTNYS